MRVRTGTAANEVMLGTARRDELRGNAGDDVLRGRAGDDVLLGGPGDDDLFGGIGGDQLTGGAGDDALRGGNGDDVLRGGTGSDLLHGGAGDDTLIGGAGFSTDTLDGEDGDDRLVVGAWSSITGGSGADDIYYAVRESNAPGTNAGFATITDLSTTEDRLHFSLNFRNHSGMPRSFDLEDFDSNNNAVLDDGDTYVRGDFPGLTIMVSSFINFNALPGQAPASGEISLEGLLVLSLFRTDSSTF